MLENAKDLNKFRKIRAKYKKKSIGGTIVKERIEHLLASMEVKYPVFGFLNETEKIDFLLVQTELLMVASGWFPGMRTVEQIEADTMAQRYFEKHGKPMPDISLAPSEENAAV